MSCRSMRSGKILRSSMAAKRSQAIARIISLVVPVFDPFLHCHPALSDFYPACSTMAIGRRSREGSDQPREMKRSRRGIGKQRGKVMGQSKAGKGQARRVMGRAQEQ